jgi:hypothetical protein
VGSTVTKNLTPDPFPSGKGNNRIEGGTIADADGRFGFQCSFEKDIPIRRRLPYYFPRDDRSRRERDRAGFAVALLIVLQQLKKMNIRLLWRDRNIENLVKISTFQ